MPDRKESGHMEARKAKCVGIRVVQFRGLAASLRNKMSREDCDIKIGNLKLLGLAGPVGIPGKGWERIIQLKPVTYGGILTPHKPFGEEPIKALIPSRLENS